MCESSEEYREAPRVLPGEVEMKKVPVLERKATIGLSVPADELVLGEDVLDSSRGSVDNFANISFFKSTKTAQKEPILKIEALHAKDLSRVTVVFLATALFMIVYSVLFISFARTVWRSELVFGGETYTIVDAPDWLQVFEIVFEGIFTLTVLFSTVVYVFAVIRTPAEKRTREMMLVVMLGLAVGIIYMPIFEIFLLINPFNDQTFFGGLQTFNDVVTASAITKGAFAAFSVYLYVWGAALSFRLPARRNFHKAFWLRVGTLSMFLLMRVLAATLVSINFSWVPFASCILVLAELHLREVGLGATQIVMVTWNTVFEGLIIISIALDMMQTQQYVKQLDYVHYRSVQIGYRQLRYYATTTFAITLVLMSLIIAISGDESITLVAKYTGIIYFEPSTGRIGYLSLIPAFALQQMYYMLPADCPSVGDILRFRWRKRELKPAEGVFAYRVFERTADPGFKPTSFVLETCITLFNLAWLPYSYGSSSKKARTPADFGNTKYTLVKYFSDSPTDTHVLVYQSADRIVVSFKGTTSGANVRTDVNSRQVPISEMFGANHAWVAASNNLETEPEGIDEAQTKTASRDGFTSSDTDGDSGEPRIPRASPWTLFTEHWRRWFRRRNLRLKHEPQIHAGFLKAYLAVRDRIHEVVEELQAEHQRPIFCTGHSLGGALATLCAYDVSQTMGQSPYVFTYGSPRVGDAKFASEYNLSVPCTWRVVLSKDPITAMPPGFYYRHVGQDALLTAEGHLFIDPTFFEMAWMHRRWMALNLKNHKKSGYKNAISNFATWRHGNSLGERGHIWDVKEIQSMSQVGTDLDNI